MKPEQFVLDLKPSYRSPDRIPELWSSRDIWVNFKDSLIPFFKEDKRVEYKIPTISLDELAKYFSMFSNTAEGGVIIVGVDKNDSPIGCRAVGIGKINELVSRV